MSALADRSTVALALECSSRLARPGHSYTAAELLANAEAILVWYEQQLAARRSADPIRNPSKAFEAAPPGFDNK